MFEKTQSSGVYIERIRGCIWTGKLLIGWQLEWLIQCFIALFDSTHMRSHFSLLTSHLLGSKKVIKKLFLLLRFE